jgi:hypothetical protein
LPAVDLTNSNYEQWIKERPSDPGRFFCSGTRAWYWDGKLHREDGLPAIEWSGGAKEWWIHGKQYRDNDLPTIERPGTRSEWHNEKGQLHRLGKPAIEGVNGFTEWYQEGKHHCESGPAINWGSTVEWWIHGEKLTKAEFDKWRRFQRKDGFEYIRSEDDHFLTAMKRQTLGT